MRIIFLESPHGEVFARELIDDEIAGSFLCRGQGVVYTHPISGELYAAPSRERFRDAVHAWEAYCELVVVESDEASQFYVVAILRRELERCGVLTEEGFWGTVLEQAEHGLL